MNQTLTEDIIRMFIKMFYSKNLWIQIIFVTKRNLCNEPSLITFHLYVINIFIFKNQFLTLHNYLFIFLKSFTILDNLNSKLGLLMFNK